MTIRLSGIKKARNYSGQSFVPLLFYGGKEAIIIILDCMWLNK